MKTKLSNYLLLSLLVYGCASGPRAYQVDPPRFIEGGFDAVWEATIDALTEIGFPLTNFEKDSGLITTDWMSIAPGGGGYTDCGSGGPLVSITNWRGRFTVFVRDDPVGTSVRVNPTYLATACLGNNCRELTCTSTGQLERALYNRAAGKVVRRPTPPSTSAAPAAEVPGWRQIGQWNGTDNWTTEAFSISGSQWRVMWSATNPRAGGSLFITVVDGAGQEVTKGATQQGAGNGQLYLTAGPGQYYIEITAVNLDWDVGVEEKL